MCSNYIQQSPKWSLTTTLYLSHTLSTCGSSSLLILNTNSSSMSLQWNAPLQPDYVITAYTLHHRVLSLKSQSEMWAPPSTVGVWLHSAGTCSFVVLLTRPQSSSIPTTPAAFSNYQINSVMTDFLWVKLHGGLPWLMFAQCGLWTSCRWIQQYQNLQRWSVAHCELQNSLVMLSLYVGASVVQFPPVTSVMARGTWYCLSRPPIPSTSPWIRCTRRPSLPRLSHC